MSSEEQALFQAILEAPDDDAPRFVYADYLEERGDPRGEYVRLACRQARKWPFRIEDPGDPESTRMWELERKHGKRWLAAMPTFEGVRWWSLWRGFPAIQVRGWPPLKRYGKRIWQLAPVEDVDFTSLSVPGARALVASPYLAQIRRLGFDWIGRGGLAAFRKLLTAPQLVRVRSLDLKSCGLGDEGAKALADCPHLTGLESLSLSCNDIDDEGAFAIARSPYLPKMPHLDLSRNPFGEEAEAALEKRWRGCT
jgi:uncharacterized protein (TIGR02996 family)